MSSLSHSPQPLTPPSTADADKIKAEHMRSSSAMPALSSLHLDQKPGLLSRSNTVAGSMNVPTAAAASMQPSSAASGLKSDGGSVGTKATSGVLGRAHSVAAMDPTKLQAAVSSASTKEGVQGSSTAWKKQRPGATSFEKLQVHLACQH